MAIVGDADSDDSLAGLTNHTQEGQFNVVFVLLLIQIAKVAEVSLAQTHLRAEVGDNNSCLTDHTVNASVSTGGEKSFHIIFVLDGNLIENIEENANVLEDRTTDALLTSKTEAGP